MANPHRGEVKFKVGEKEWVLVYSINSLCELEEELGLGINEVAELLGDPKKMRLQNVRAVLWAGLRDYQPDIDIKAAGNLIKDLGLPAAIDLIAKGFALAFPAAEAGDQRPQVPVQAQSPAGTGKLS